jgi:hypothetical protein
LRFSEHVAQRDLLGIEGDLGIPTRRSEDAEGLRHLDEGEHIPRLRIDVLGGIRNELLEWNRRGDPIARKPDKSFVNRGFGTARGGNDFQQPIASG